MPINAKPEYFEAERKYQAARTREEKIVALEEMIRTAPKHKGAENLLAELRKRLAKLKKESSTKTASRPEFIIKKEGAAQVCILGLTNSGKSSLLNSLTNANAEVADYEYTTKKPEVGMMDYGGVKIQLIEIPSTFTPSSLSFLNTCDLILILLDSSLDLHEQMNKLLNLITKYTEDKKILVVANKNDLKHHKDIFSVSVKNNIGLEKLKDEIWSRLNLIRVYTKTPGKESDKTPLALPLGSTVEDMVKHIHKSLLKNFKFARIFNSTKFSGRKVGLAYKLNDLDTVEIHMR